MGLGGGCHLQLLRGSIVWLVCVLESCDVLNRVGFFGSWPWAGLCGAELVWLVWAGLRSAGLDLAVLSCVVLCWDELCLAWLGCVGLGCAGLG